MTYAIIGSGHVGTALARQFARNRIAVLICNTRGPDSLNELVNELGASVTAASLQDALEADTILLAVHFAAHPEIAKARKDWKDWKGKTVIDVTNFRETDLTPLGGLQSSDFVAKGLPGAKVVKTFNQLPAALLASDPAEGGGRRVMFVAGNHDDANTEVASLVASLGFAPIILGKIAEGGSLLRFRGPLVLQNLIELGA
jgi:predicted dinucleotide-binding enzyme